jgi:hypothetical protein
VSASTCSICGRDPKGHLAPAENGEIVCLGCTAQLTATLLGKGPTAHCVCGFLVYFETPEYVMHMYCPRCSPSTTLWDSFALEVPGE